MKDSAIKPHMHEKSSEAQTEICSVLKWGVNQVFVLKIVSELELQLCIMLTTPLSECSFECFDGIGL